jgi:hypothetical protein
MAEKRGLLLSDKKKKKIRRIKGLKTVSPWPRTERKTIILSSVCQIADLLLS